MELEKRNKPWRYSKRAIFEMEMLDRAGSGYFFPIPECWKEYYNTEQDLEEQLQLCHS